MFTFNFFFLIKIPTKMRQYYSDKTSWINETAYQAPSSDNKALLWVTNEMYPSIGLGLNNVLDYAEIIQRISLFD